MDIAATYTFTTDNLKKSEGFAAVYLQNPAQPGGFLAPLTYSVGESPVALAVADLNGDGKLDLVVLNSQTGNPDSLADHVSVLLQDPTNPGHFLNAVNYSTAHLPTAVAIGDLDGDGRPDLAVADLTGISLLLQNPATPGSFLPYSEITALGFADSIAIADLNNDGKQDLAITDGSAVQVLLQSQNKPLTFAAPVKYSAGLTPAWVVPGDLDSDGNVDLVVANLGAMDGTGGSVSILLQDSAAPGSFLGANTFATGRSATFAALADIDGDHLTDIAVANAEGYVSLLIEQPHAPGQFAPPSKFYSQSNLSALAVGDLNSDGRVDIVTVGSDGILFHLQDPAHPGTFLAPTVVAAP